MNKSKQYCLLFFFFVACFFSPASFLNASPAAENDDAEYNTPGNGTLTDANLLYLGRWDKTNATYYHGHWAGASIRVDFTGTSIKINLANTDWIYLVVQIDNETPRAVLAQNGTSLNLGALVSGRHTITVGAGVGGSEMLFKGFTLDTGAVTYKSEKRPLIEFIGDSITEGGGPAGIYTYNYAWKVANQMGCDRTQIASSAIALCSGYSIFEANRVGMDSLYFGLKNYKYSYEPSLNGTFVPWNFSTYTPDIVFMFLGTNDSDGVPWIYNATDQVFSERLDKFLKRIRSKFPNAYIAVMNPFTGVFKNVIESKIQDLKSAGDDKLYFVNSTGWLTSTDFSDGIHPNDAGTAKMVNNLYSFLNPIVQSIKDGSDYEGPEEPSLDKFYLVPSTEWKDSNASFGAIFKNGTTEEKVAFTLNNSTGKYELNIPAGDWPQICIRRYAPDGVSEWGGFTTFDAISETHTSNFIAYNRAFNHIEIIGWANGTDPNGYVTSTYGSVSTTEKFYLIPSADWLSDGATFAAIFSNGATEEKVSFTLNSTTGMYELPIPAGTWTQVSARRYSPDGTGDWGGFATLNGEVYSTNYIPYDGSFNCIEVTGWANGTDPNQYILSTYPFDPADGITIRFKKPASWPLVNIHAWDAVGTPIAGFDWPGNPMVEEAANPGWYSYTFDPSVKFVSFQFNKGDDQGIIVKEAVTESTSYDENGNVVGTVSITTANAAATVFAEINRIVASFDGTAFVEIYSVMGQRLFAGSAAGEFVYPADAGIYLVKINGKTFKVLVP